MAEASSSSEHVGTADADDVGSEEISDLSSVDASCDEDDSNDGSVGGTEAGQKKKKKKKKKKKAAKDTAADGSEHPPAASGDKASKDELDKRFNAAMELLRNKLDLWVDLSNTNLHDGKAKKVVEALKQNGTVTALNLSGNCITDAGAQALASALGAGGGEELIELDLRGNELTDAGLTALEGLKKLRKQLKVRTGPLQGPEPDASTSAAGSGKQAGKKGGPAAAGSGGTSDNMLKELAQGPMFRKYFQTGEDDDEDSGAAATGYEDSALDYTDRAEELWEQVKAAVAGGRDSIPAISTALWTVCIFLDREVSHYEGSLTAIPLERLRPHTRQAAASLQLLGEVLDLLPVPVTVQFASQPQSAVGSHRLWAAEVVCLLLSLGCLAMDQLVSATQLVHALVDLAFAHPLNNALQVRTLRLLHACLHSQHTELWAPLLEPSPSTGTASLQERLAEIVNSAREVLPGKRPGNVGFALDATRLLQDCCTQGNPGYVAAVHKALQASPSWTTYWESEAAQGVWREQEGVLGGGERPKKFDPVADDQREMESRIISGHNLLSILQLHGMNAVPS